MTLKASLAGVFSSVVRLIVSKSHRFLGRWSSAVAMFLPIGCVFHVIRKEVVRFSVEGGPGRLARNCLEVWELAAKCETVVGSSNPCCCFFGI